jgi:hypothetical protein
MEADHSRFKPKIHNSYFAKSLVNIDQFWDSKINTNFRFRTKTLFFFTQKFIYTKSFAGIDGGKICYSR